MTKFDCNYQTTKLIEFKYVRHVDFFGEIRGLRFQFHLPKIQVNHANSHLYYEYTWLKNGMCYSRIFGEQIAK